VIVLLAESVDGRVVALLDPKDLSLRHGNNLAHEPRDDFDLVDHPLPADLVFPAGRGVTPRALRLRGALARSLMMAGALERSLELAIEHARNRIQFGRKIGTFQAIQHEIARLGGEVAAARAAAGSAVNALDRNDALLAVASAKIRTGEAAGVGSMIAHQVHGAIGATDEYGLHHLSLRLWAWREEFGNEAAWSAELGRATVRAGADRLWPSLTAS
jgi:acyl-CoA dehydrogenase